MHDNVFNIFLFHFILIIDAKGPGPIGGGTFWSQGGAHFGVDILIDIKLISSDTIL